MNKVSASAATEGFIGDFSESLGFAAPARGVLWLKKPENYAMFKLDAGAAVGAIGGAAAGQELFGRAARVVTSNNMRVAQARFHGAGIFGALGVIAGIAAASQFVKPGTEVEQPPKP